MKKRHFLQLFFAVFTVILIAISCKKNQIIEKRNILSEAKEWYQQKIGESKTSLQSNKGIVKDVKQEVQWNNARTFTFDDGRELVGAPLEVTLANGKTNGSYMLLISNDSGSYSSLVLYNQKSDYFKSNISVAEVQQLYNKVINDTKAKLAALKLRVEKSDLPMARMQVVENPTEVCTDWYWATTVYDSWGNIVDYYETYLYTTCTDTGGDGDGGSGGDGEDQKDTDCESFSFTQTSSANWQEAGLNKIYLKMIWIGEGGAVSVRSMEVNHMVFGLPTFYTNANGTTTPLSHGGAANVAAKAVEYARNMTYTEFRNSPLYPSEATIIAYFKQQTNLYMLGHMGTAGVTGSGSSLIIFNNEERSDWTNPTDCE